MSPGKAAGIAHCCDHDIVGDQRIDVSDEDLAEVESASGAANVEETAEDFDNIIESGSKIC